MPMWRPFYDDTDRLQRSLDVGQNADGRLEVFGIGPGNRIWHTWQVAPNGGWNGEWVPFYRDTDRLRSLDVGQNADGWLEVFGIGPDDRIWHTWQVAPSNGWND